MLDQRYERLFSRVFNAWCRKLLMAGVSKPKTRKSYPQLNSMYAKKRIVFFDMRSCSLGLILLHFSLPETHKTHFHILCFLRFVARVLNSLYQKYGKLLGEGGKTKSKELSANTRIS